MLCSGPHLYVPQEFLLRELGRLCAAVAIEHTQSKRVLSVQNKTRQGTRKYKVGRTERRPSRGEAKARTSKQRERAEGERGVPMYANVG